MSDEQLRALEQTCKASPDDEEARHRLERARLRSGLGWHGEQLPEGIIPHRERHVYFSGFDPVGLALQFVYVPGGEVECSSCRDGADCSRPDHTQIAPFYVGRFPVTWRDHIAYVRALGNKHRFDDIEAAHAHEPVTYVTHADAQAFCEWAGLRLPTAQEWRWAALGAPRSESSCHDCGNVTPFEGPCARGGIPTPGGHSWSPSQLISRLYPWGDDPPTPERCAAADPRYRPHMPDGPMGSTAPVVRCAACVRGDCYVAAACAERLDVPSAWKEPLVPARPLGASWCGAQDMVGNVMQWVQDDPVEGLALCLGSHYASPLTPEHLLDVSQGAAAPSEHVGFRVALSAP